MTEFHREICQEQLFEWMLLFEIVQKAFFLLLCGLLLFYFMVRKYSENYLTYFWDINELIEQKYLCGRHSFGEYVDYCSGKISPMKFKFYCSWNKAYTSGQEKPV